MFTREEEEAARYALRNDQRLKTLLKATMNLVGYFVSLDVSADPIETKMLNAQNKVKQVSTELRKIDGGAKFDYVLGDTQPLIDAVNLIDEGILPFMDAAAKNKLSTDLTIV